MPVLMLDLCYHHICIMMHIILHNVNQFLATSYHVSVKTGDCRGAGTDANVFLKVFGEAGDTGKLQLKNAENSKNKFERAMTDLFKLEATDIGKVHNFPISNFHLLIFILY